MATLQSEHSGKLTILGIGPGAVEQLTYAATQALVEADIFLGCGRDLELIAVLTEGKQLIIMNEYEPENKIQKAFSYARAGSKVVFLTSGDSGIYGLAGIALELMSDEHASHIPVQILPGIPALIAGASLAGAPLMQDFAVINMSTRYSSQETILKRLKAAVEGDFVISLYSPKCRNCIDLMDKALMVIQAYRSAGTPTAIINNGYTKGQSVMIQSLGEIPGALKYLDSTSLMIIGNSETYQKGPWMITPGFSGAAECSDSDDADTDADD